jgi:hypothetical protein
MTAEYLEKVFRNCVDGHGLSFFKNDEPQRVKFRTQETRIEIFCEVRKRWRKATPEEVVRQCFILWIVENLKFPISRLQVEHRMQRGSDADRERIDIVVFSDDACSDPFILFELKKPDFKDGIEQLRSYLRWSGSFFGAWSNGNDHSFQLREEDPETKKSPYRYRDIPRLPANGQDISDVLTPLSFAELSPIHDLRSLVYPEHVRKLSIYVRRNRGGSIDKRWHEQLATKVTESGSARATANRRLQRIFDKFAEGLGLNPIIYRE